MSGSTFKTNPVSLRKLLERCEQGDIKLPDFQRSWVWDDGRIRSLIASLSQAFPVGALMTLESGGKTFSPRPVQGAPAAAASVTESELLLDGQQRMTSLYQALVRKAPVDKVNGYYYLDMEKALQPSCDREEAVISVPHDRVKRSDFGRQIDLDLSTPELEYGQSYFPLNQVFDWDAWQDGYWDHWDRSPEKRELFRSFKKQILQAFTDYDVPVISLDRSTTVEAVCLVFEKVNTGGKPLDAFELVTATFAGQGFKLREDWFGKGGSRQGRAGRLHGFKVLSKVSPTEFLQGVSLLHTKAKRADAQAAGVSPDRLPPVSATKSALLSLPVEAYRRHADALEKGYTRAAKFLVIRRIYRSLDLPYQSQLVPLAAILAELGEDWEHENSRRKVTTWFWNGVFGELYGSAVESRFARDVQEVPAWIAGGPEPSTVTEASVRAGRVRELRSRLSAAYKGVNALIMASGAKDFRSGQDYDHAVFFDESVDVHHIFPRDWCQKAGLPIADYDSIVNKTPLSSKTNRILGGVAPSRYLTRLEVGPPPIAGERLDGYVASHKIASSALRSDDFNGMFERRLEDIIQMIESATGRTAFRDVATSQNADAITSAPYGGYADSQALSTDDEAEASEAENIEAGDDAALIERVP